MSKGNANIAIVLASNLHWAPFVNRYLDILKSNRYQYDLIMWNRENIIEDIDANLITFDLKDETNNGSFIKAFKFILYANFVKKVLKRNEYKKVLFVGTYAGVPALLYKFLRKEYENRYWIDLRDLTYEKIPFFYKMEEIAMKHAFHTVVSSKGFLKYLPCNIEYGFIHNIDPSMDEIVLRYKKTISDKIRISYIGNLGYWNSCKEMIDLLANDERFQLNFIGPNYEKIEKYCKIYNINNVRFHGKFKREDTVQFYNETDVIFNLYGNDNINVRTALSNKLYYAMRFKLPILVNKNTYMEEVVQKYSIGITFKNDSAFKNELYEYVKSFNVKEHYFEEAWSDVVQEDLCAIAQLKGFMRGC